MNLLGHRLHLITCIKEIDGQKVRMVEGAISGSKEIPLPLETLEHYESLGAKRVPGCAGWVWYPGQSPTAGGESAMSPTNNSRSPR